MSITYQQAKRIRKTGLMGVFADQLMYEKSVGTAIKKTVSLKTRAAVKGVTQYLDPLNIAKMLTFGSALGPALLGHFMKRDVRDIQYFTGRLKPIHERNKTASKISKVPGGEGSDGALNPILRKMYKLMSNTHEENVKRRQLSKNREEENQLEDERRHQQLIKALSNLTGVKTVTNITTEKGDNGGLFDFFKKLLEDGLAKVQEGLKWITDLKDTLVKFFGSTLFGLLNAIRGIASLSVLGPMIIGAAPLAILYKVSQWAQDAKLFDANGNPTTEFNFIDKVNKLAGGQGITPEADKTKSQRILDEGSMWQSDKPFIKKWMDRMNQGTSISQSEAEALKVRYNIEWPKNLIIENQTPSATVIKETPTATATVNNTPMPEFDTGSGSDWDNSTPTAKLNSVMQENLTGRVAVGVLQKTPAPTQVNNTNVNQQVDKTTPIKRPIPSVRNQEEEYMNRTLSNTRVAN